MPQLSLHSPFGDLSISEDDGAIVALDWGWGRDQTPSPLLKDAVKQLNAYFDGKLTAFDLPLAPFGTAFQKSVWQQMRKIPYGKTRTYGAMAGRLKSGARPVGTATLGGYSGAGGLETKVALLRLEGVMI